MAVTNTTGVRQGQDDPLGFYARQIRAVSPTAPRRRSHPAGRWLATALSALGYLLAGPVARALLRGRDFLLQLGGFALVSYGAWLWLPPLGFVVAGLSLLYLQALLSPVVETPQVEDEQ